MSNTHTIPLPDGSHATVDADDYAYLKHHHWYRNSEGYAVCPDGAEMHTMHRVVIDAQPGDIVDHINGDKLDNRRANLRLVTASQNAQNRPPNNPTGYKGVTPGPGTRWLARISHEGHQYHLGTYPTREDAAHAYNIAATHLFGTHAYQNDVAGGLDRTVIRDIYARLNGTYDSKPLVRQWIPRRESPFRGVYWERGRWRAKIGYQNGKIHLGYYENEVEAARAYDKAAREYHGERAKLNFPDEEDVA